ncbi:MAG: nuclear pore complex subunit [Bacteroidetes bacterium HGW-Bacteroidetes-15]|nr:MAG: nuclear pore complex subunit [Bacteroidetes bacterium HGW-Bacteroidetes-15]
MSNFFIKQGEDTPEILIDFDAGLVEIAGKSLPEDSTSFYIPVENAVKEYISNPKPKTTINLRLEYLNSSSQKRILEILTLLEELIVKGFEVQVNWFYNPEDEDILEEGKDLAKMLKLPLNIISKQVK